MGRGSVRRASLLLGVAFALACGGGDEVPEERELAVEPAPVGVQPLLGGDSAGAPSPDAPPAAPGANPSPAGGATPPRSGTDGQRASEITVEGTVALGGSAQAQLLTLRTGDAAWLLEGAPAAELRRLDGATVRVTGRPGGEPGAFRPLLRPLTVTAYTLESIGGEKPVVGRVSLRDGEAVLVTDGATLRLAGAGTLGEQVGARVWVLGRRSGETLDVASYGVIRPAP